MPTMQACAIHQPGGFEALQLQEIPIPAVLAEAHQVMERNQASGKLVVTVR